MKQILLFATLIFGSLAVQAQSIEALRDSMAAGNLNSQVDLALKYMYGEDVEQDIDKAFSLIRDAANKGNSNGELWLGLCYHMPQVLIKTLKKLSVGSQDRLKRATS